MDDEYDFPVPKRERETLGPIEVGLLIAIMLLANNANHSGSDHIADTSTPTPITDLNTSPQRQAQVFERVSVTGRPTPLE
jgi:hypothetical protein